MNISKKWFGDIFKVILKNNTLIKNNFDYKVTIYKNLIFLENYTLKVSKPIFYFIREFLILSWIDLLDDFKSTQKKSYKWASN